MGNSEKTFIAAESWTAGKNWYLYLAVALIAGSIFLGCIISPPSLVDDVDAVHAQMARTMLTSGDWVTAHLDGVPYLEKAPLLYWLIAGTYKIFGVHDWAARIPIALAAAGYWRTFIAAAATAVLLTLVTTLVFGVQVWHAFFVGAEFTRTVVLEQGDTGWHKIQSIFSWARMWGAPITVAYVLQVLLIACLAGAVIWLWRSHAPFSIKAASLCLATVLATPFTFDYDMMVLAPAIAWFT